MSNSNNHNRFLRSNFLFDFIKEERNFLLIISLLLIFIGFIYPFAGVARWVGFALAGYSAIANDSIQTIGTFIASNQDKKWWVLWLFIGGIFLATVAFSWFVYDGDVSHQRLLSANSDGTLKFPEPQSFHYLQVAAPVVLLLLTRMRMPVSTTFLLLSSFSANPGAIGEVVIKSLGGYAVAFIVAMVVWLLFTHIFDKYFKGKAPFYWTVLQWVSSGSLWSVWVMQDAANIAIYLPRQLSMAQFLGFGLFIFAGLGVLFYLKGDKIQGVVTEKTNITDVRAATVIDFTYSIILFAFKFASKIPMSTTWVFIGLLGGRELAIHIARKTSHKPQINRALKILGRDILFAGIGLLVSIILAVAANPKLQEDFAKMFGL